MEQIDDAVSKGATVHTGGHRVDRPGAFVEATVLSGVTPEMRAFSEELFGPAAVVYRVAERRRGRRAGQQQRLRARRRGLQQRRGSWPWTWPTGSTSAWCGSTGPRAAAPELPFGGTKRSGVGRELGPLGIDEFVNKKLIHTSPE